MLPSWQSMKTTTILITCADPIEFQLLDLLLSQDGYAIVRADTAREALKYLRENTPDLAILTLDLPDLGGDVVCRKIKAVSRLRDVPVVLLAALPPRGMESKLRLTARDAGADLLLTYPLGDKDVRGRVRRLLNVDPVSESPLPEAGSVTPTTVSR